MIAVEESHEKLQAPATSLEELADRLYPLVGRVLKIRRSRRADLYPNTFSAALESVWFIDQRPKEVLTAYIAAPAAGNGQKIDLNLDSEISVFADGLWSTVHTPKES